MGKERGVKVKGTQRLILTRRENPPCEGSRGKLNEEMRWSESNKDEWEWELGGIMNYDEMKSKMLWWCVEMRFEGKSGGIIKAVQHGSFVPSFRTTVSHSFSGPPPPLTSPHPPIVLPSMAYNSFKTKRNCLYMYVWSIRLNRIWINHVINLFPTFANTMTL